MEDLSHMLSLETGLTGGESMNAANMTSSRPDSLMSAPGSEPLLPPGIVDNPNVEVPGYQDFRPIVHKGGDK